MMEEHQSNQISNNQQEPILPQQPEEVVPPETIHANIPVNEPVTNEVGAVSEAVTPVVSDKLDADTKLFAAISYLSGLFVIPLVAKKNNHFVSFHVKQGMTLFIVEIVIWFVLWLVESFLEGVFSYRAVGLIQFLYKLAWLVFGAASILGIYHALTGKEKPLPYLSIVAKNLKF
ncbi:MAG: hypothetical protein V1719_02970 [Patescibacteria group bacterium]